MNQNNPNPYNYGFPYYPYDNTYGRQEGEYGQPGGFPSQGQFQQFVPTPDMQVLPGSQAAGPQPGLGMQGGGMQAPGAGMMVPVMGGQPQGMGAQAPGQLPVEESYIENILRLNRGKLATVYMTFEGRRDGENTLTFRGIIEAAGRDHIVISDPQTGMRYLLLMVYLDYVTFEEEIEYEYPYAAGGMAVYPPR
ncbi:spore coat protein GerQ [Peribacillus saganii]|uniref:Spore coat protein GerQ n=1 Tax=Peribacillus saganii TaxID=2303992 RepID=A0A372LRQ8_9BACI|nr:spore coat protein GerQ [Peribacillus saganii]RFU70878.1 spore coat protein GerQ [Peribacillus saganii]